MIPPSSLYIFDSHVPDIVLHDIRRTSTRFSAEPPTLDSVLHDLIQWKEDVGIVHCQAWHHIPSIVTSFSDRSEASIQQMIILLDLIGNVLNHLGELGVSISNKRLLSSSLHSLERSPSCDHRLKRRAHTVLIALDGISDTPLVVVEKTELDSLEEEVCNLREETKKLRELEGKSDRQMNELKRMIESLQPTLSLQSGKTIDKDTPSLPNPKTEPFQLRIVCASNGHIFDININPGNTVLQLKQTLVPSICVPVQRMSLMNESEELADSLTVSAIDFGGNDSLILIINDSDEPPDLIPLTIRDQMNRSSTVRISPTKTVRDLKDIISLREHVRSSSVILFYYGRTLNSNSATLAECGIVADSEVVFVAHIIGGGEPAIEV